MPIYEFRCDRCGRLDEQRRSFDDRRRAQVCNALTSCSALGSDRCTGTLQLQVSVPSKAVVPGGTGAGTGDRS